MALSGKAEEQACRTGFFHWLRSTPQASGSEKEESCVEQVERNKDTKEESARDLAEKTLQMKEEESLRETVESVLQRMERVKSRMDRMEERLQEHTSILHEIRNMVAMIYGEVEGSTGPQCVTQVNGEEEKGTGKEGDEENGEEAETDEKMEKVEEEGMNGAEEKGEDGAKEENEKAEVEFKEVEKDQGKGKHDQGHRKKWSLWKVMKIKWQKKNAGRTVEGESEMEDLGEGTSGCTNKEWEGKEGNQGASEEVQKEKKKGIWSSLKRKFQRSRSEEVKGEKKKMNSQDKMVAAVTQKQTADIMDINIVVGRQTKVMQYFGKRR